MRKELTVSRRAVLAAGSAGAGAVVLAACGSSSSSGGSSAAGPATTGAPASAAAATTAAASPAPSAPAAAGLAKLADIPVGEAIAVTLPGGKDGVIARPTADTAVAFSAICTHMGCTVKPAGKELHCPCHGSTYNATTGSVIQGPAPDPLPKVEVHVANGQVLAGAS